MSQLWHRNSELVELNLQVMIVTFDQDALARAYLKQTQITWPLLFDDQRELYQAYGLTRGSWWAIYGLPSIGRYLQLILRGQLPGRPGKDWRQLGGDVLIDPQGIVRVCHRSQTPHDRPDIDAVLSLTSSPS